ncbi:N-acetyltransferase [Amycolatopsis sp. YIM 10]|uniref:GNAT family N-acetyltransferase n=1 Tax=Amycolatopsis sp. YIM 10 TaxID=2653857 RepID=UPI0012A916A5|nr:GNAT family N-acetyltransferase [Amycolatopsis sp. YIM 10]QFU88782.1 Mycothiol acetyltransferase [Amycolatopsis sp. YIM 10]
MTGLAEIRRARAAEAGPIAGLIATAFEPLDVSRWLVPEPAPRRATLAANFRILVEYVLAHGHIDVIGDRAAAVWLPQEAGVDLPPPPDYDARLLAACGPYTDRFLALDDAFAANHPHEPHHHLAFLAVHPEVQGRGLGAALLRHHHARLDAAGTAAYLEASNLRATALYEREGYEFSGAPFHLPDGPPFHPMWREPA